MVPLKKKVGTGVVPIRKQHGEIYIYIYHGAQSYCVLCKRAVIPERKRKPRISENFLGNIFYQEYVNDGLGGGLGNRDDVVKYSKKYERKRKRDMKTLKK